MKNKAFTLLELLVVIGIIGTMMALATVAYSKTQISGRDSRRKQDLVAIQNALEQYYAASGYVYPGGAAGAEANCNLANDSIRGSWPVDPSSLLDYDGVAKCKTTEYCICALLESGKNGNSIDSSCNFTGVEIPPDVMRKYYCVGNLQ